MLASCIKNESGDYNELEIVDRYLTTTSYDVQVDGNGAVTEVFYVDADGVQTLLARTAVPLTIQVPAWLEGETVTRAGGPQGLSHLEIAKHAAGYDNFASDGWVKESSSVLMFEDSRFGDFDYNDLVLYVKHQIRGNGTTTPGMMTMWVKPIALGGYNDIAFGWEDGNGEHILTDNVRRDYFNGRSGIINTYNTDDGYIPSIPVVDGGGNTVCNGYTIVSDRTLMERVITGNAHADHIVGGYFKYDAVPTTANTTSNDAKAIKYFIKTGRYKFYVASVDKNAPEGQFPYGLSITNGLYHATETTPLDQTYPGFYNWIVDGTPGDWTKNRVTGLIYTKHTDYARW